MRKEPQKLTTDFKLKVILEAIQKRFSMKEIVQKYDLNPIQITNWKRDFLDKAVTIMDTIKGL